MEPIFSCSSEEILRTNLSTSMIRKQRVGETLKARVKPFVNHYADGRRKKLIYPDSTFITYEYNTKGWLTAIKDGGTNNIVAYDYDNAGRRTKRTLENNTFTDYDYDAADQLSVISHQQSAGGATNLISRYEYGYDAAGNRTNMVGTAGSTVRSEAYSYDAADQITGVTYTTNGLTVRAVSYGYDAAGNRTNMVEIVGNWPCLDLVGKCRVGVCEQD